LQIPGHTVGNGRLPLDCGGFSDRRDTSAYTSLVAMYVALRGINVGGKNLIRMPALKASFEAGGFEDVVTYIASGNVLFRAPRPGTALADRIERMLSTRSTTGRASC
jgi:hypothetical protein